MELLLHPSRSSCRCWVCLCVGFTCGNATGFIAARLVPGLFCRHALWGTRVRVAVRNAHILMPYTYSVKWAIDCSPMCYVRDSKLLALSLSSSLPGEAAKHCV